jgi:hypothetical protein
MNGVISNFPIVAAVVPAIGTSVGAHSTPGALGTNQVTLDITCTTTAVVRGVTSTSTHQTHWIGTI